MACIVFYRHTSQLPPSVSQLDFVLVGAFAAANVVFAIAIMCWRKWGVWGYLMTSFITTVESYRFLGLKAALTVLGGSVVLLVVLSLGGNQRVWPRLSNHARQR